MAAPTAAFSRRQSDRDKEIEVTTDSRVIQYKASARYFAQRARHYRLKADAATGSDRERFRWLSWRYAQQARHDRLDAQELISVLLTSY